MSISYVLSMFTFSFFFFFFNDTATTEIYTLSLHDALPIWLVFAAGHDHAEAGHHHDGEYLARAQAGIILRPAGLPPTPAQAHAAAELATRTAAEIGRAHV